MKINILTKKQVKEIVKEEVEKREAKLINLIDKCFQKNLRLEETLKILEMRRP